MKLNSISRSLIVFVLAAITVVLCYAFPNAANSAESGMVIWLPPRIEGHIGEEIEISEQEAYWLPKDTTQLKMQYRPYGVDSWQAPFRVINATLILSGSDKRSLHRPEVCMTGQGWTIEKREVVPIQTNGGLLEVMDLYLKRPYEREDGTAYFLKAHYVYWWVGAQDSTPHSWQRLLRSAANNIFRNQNDRWGYPSVMVQVDPTLREEGVNEARERAFSFIAEHAPKFQKSLGAKDRPDAKPIKVIDQ